MFAETPLIRKKRRRELVAKCIFGAMSVIIVVPLVLIVGYLFKEAWPLLSWDFLTSNPTGGMRRGGIWSALLGTLFYAWAAMRHVPLAAELLTVWLVLMAVLQYIIFRTRLGRGLRTILRPRHDGSDVGGFRYDTGKAVMGERLAPASTATTLPFRSTATPHG